MSVWSDLQRTQEYRKAKAEVDRMIQQKIAPLQLQISQLQAEVNILKSRLR